MNLFFFGWQRYGFYGNQGLQMALFQGYLIVLQETIPKAGQDLSGNTLHQVSHYQAPVGADSITQNGQ